MTHVDKSNIYQQEMLYVPCQLSLEVVGFSFEVIFDTRLFVVV